jgi:tricorn protease
MRETRNIYLAVLRKDLPSPLVKESDEEKESKGTDTTKDKDKDTDDKKPSEPKPDTSAQQPGSPSAPHGGGATDSAASKAADSAPFRVDLEDIQFRTLDLPVPAANLSNLQAGGAGQIYFLREADGKTSLQRFDLEKRKVETLAPDVVDYRVSADSKKLLYKVKDSWFIVPTTKEIKPGDGQDRCRLNRGEGRSPSGVGRSVR